MIRKLFFLGFFITSIGILHAQVLSPDEQPLDAPYKKENINQRKAIPYQHIREADVMWSKKVWRKMDLREKMNLPFYYPIIETNGMRSLADLLYHSVTTEGTPRIYRGNADDFSEQMTVTELKSMIEKKDTQWVQDLDNPDGPLIPKERKSTFSASRVKTILIQEEWMFDKHRSVLECRIIGICPMYENEDKEKGETALFWVYFPEVRPLLAKSTVFNPQNPAENKSFDDLFWKRMFSSYITKEKDVYDRAISEYAKGIDALLESERIKNEILVKEHDLWEF